VTTARRVGVILVCPTHGQNSTKIANFQAKFAFESVQIVTNRSKSYKSNQNRDESIQNPKLIPTKADAMGMQEDGPSLSSKAVSGLLTQCALESY
jgi:hypothetical protein